MVELVDTMVSNTIGLNSRAGSTPALGTQLDENRLYALYKRFFWLIIFLIKVLFLDIDGVLYSDKTS